MIQKKLVAHPINVEWLCTKAMTHDGTNLDSVKASLRREHGLLVDIRIVVDASMDVWYDDTRFVITPTGVAKRAGFKMRTKFITYEESDIDILIYCGTLMPYMVRKFVIQDDFRMLMPNDFGAYVPASKAIWTKIL